MIIRSAEFITSAVNSGQYPDIKLPEFAFIGRSNVGKSSLINMLTGRKLLARISSSPGKTRTLNFFNINEQWLLVDMPGYGYARASKKLRDEFQGIISEYLTKRKQMIYLCILVDIRHKPLAADLDFIENCAENSLPFVIIFTKKDKVKRNEEAATIAAYKKSLSEIFEEMPLIFITSAETGEGKDEVADFIFSQASKYAAAVKKI